jgi:DNA-binding response OmpR family regulator
LLPILCTSGRCDLGSRVKGLRSGFDHYLTKPFAPEELEAVLVRAWCRDEHRERREDGAASPPLNLEWRLHQQAQALVLDGQLSVSLTETELRLLCLLEQRAPEALSHAALIAGLGHHQRYYSTARLHTAISRLRRKIAQATDCPPPFSTVYGAGYVWDSAPEPPRDQRELSE